MRHDRDSEDVNSGKSPRRIVVRDTTLPSTSRENLGRRLKDPPKSEAAARLPAPVQKIKPPPVRRLYLWLGLSGGIVLLALFVGMLVTHERPREATAPVPTPTVQATGNSTAGTSPEVVPSQSNESDQIEEGAKQVIRQISRDNKPYSFSERAIEDIRLRVLELRQASSLPSTLTALQENSGAIRARAAKEGLQPSLVILLALALTKGGERGDSLAAATRAVPLLASLNKMFGSNEADSSLILIAALQEGMGTHRSHPLLRRMKRVVTNPLAERNVWFLHDQNVLTNDAYDLVVDTIAYGVIARNPRQFGLDNDPLSL
jgi:hypothetical protein